MIKTGIIEDDIPLRVGLYLSDIINFSMSRVNIQDSKGFGLFSLCLYGHTTIDDCNFESNQANDSVQKYNGGNAILTYLDCHGYDTQHAHVEINNSQFLRGLSIHRHIATGLVIYLKYPNIDVTINNATMKGNIAKHTGEYEPRNIQGGNLAVIYYNISRNNTVKIHDSRFDGGEALMGAGMYVIYSLNTMDCTNQLMVENSSFTNNIAHKDGGAIYLELVQGISTGNYTYCNATNNFILSECQFTNNTVKTNNDAGIGITVTNLYLNSIFFIKYTYYSILLTNCVFKHNTNTPSSDGSYSSGSAVLYSSYQVGRLMIEDCTFIHNEVTAMAAFRSYLYFSGNVTIHNNTGYEGGGIVLCEASFMFIGRNTTLTISNNHANVSGGGIFAEGRCAQSEPLCFYQLIIEPNENVTEILDATKIHLTNNTAVYAGSQIFGGTADNCHIPNVHKDIFFDLFKFSHPQNDTSYISSDPLNVCFCNESMLPDCSIDNQSFVTYSGQKFNVSLVTVGQYDGTVPGVADLSASDNGTIQADALKPLGKNCTSVPVTVYTDKNKVWVKVQVKNQHANFLLNVKRIKIIVHIKDTPIGFASTGDSSEPYICTMHPENITMEGFKCFIENDTGVILRPTPKWLGYHKSPDHNISGFFVQPHCPLDYCHERNVHIKVTDKIFSQDDQCNNDRSGILCGQCKPNYSLSMSSFVCIDCRDYPMKKTIGWSLVFIISGIVFVFMLLLINFTVTQGMLSELLFYANTVFVFKSTFLPSTAVDSPCKQMLSLIINVINLNYGYRNCFFHGMDMVGRTWLQFLLVIYLWTIAIVIVLLCRKFTRFANFIGYNSVQVLATILLFSYSSLVLGILYSLAFTFLQLPESKKTVMLYDGNVPYFSKKHIGLFIVGSVFAILSLAFTLTLLCIQPLQRYSHWRLLKWVNKLKPLIDAYTCPHIIKPHCRFWNGFLLLVRSTFYIFLIAGYNSRVILTSISIICVIVLGTAWSLGGVYQRSYLNYISSSYIMNCCVLSILTIFFNDPHAYAAVTTSCISISITTAILLGILLCHILTQLRKRRCLSRLVPLGIRNTFRNLRLAFKRNDYQILTGYANADEDEIMSYGENRVQHPFIRHHHIETQ